MNLVKDLRLTRMIPVGAVLVALLAIAGAGLLWPSTGAEAGASSYPPANTAGAGGHAGLSATLPFPDATSATVAQNPAPDLTVTLGAVSGDPMTNIKQIKRGETVDLEARAYIGDDTDSNPAVSRWQWFRVRFRNTQGKFHITRQAGNESDATWTPPTSFARDDYPATGCSFGSLGGFEIRVRAYNEDRKRFVNDKSEPACVAYLNTDPVITQPRSHYISPGGNTVTLVTQVCDNDDPIWFDADTGLCPTAATERRARKPSSYLHEFQVTSDSGRDVFVHFWNSSDGSIQMLQHARWRANFTPPADAENGDRYTVTYSLTDPDLPCHSAGGCSFADRQVATFTVEVQGKPEPEPEPVSSFSVIIEADDAAIPLGKGTKVRATVEGDYTLPLTYDWKVSYFCSGTWATPGGGSITTRAPHSVDYPMFTPHRPGRFIITLTVTDKNGAENRNLPLTAVLVEHGEVCQ